MSRLRVALCQLNPVVGDLDGNVAAVLAALDQAEAQGADLAVFSELVLTGYPPEDLLLKPGFVADQRVALGKIAARTRRCAAVLGFVDEGVDLYNAAAICAGGEVRGVYRKQNLPNSSVFDEQRYFVAGTGARELYEIAGVRVGLSVCEDAWNPAGPIAEQAAAGAELIVNINASPYFVGRLGQRHQMLATRAADASCALVYVNQVGGQDELVFDGGSMVFDADGELVARLAQFTEVVQCVDVDVRSRFRKRLLDPRGRNRADELTVVTVSESAAAVEPIEAVRVQPLEPIAEIFEALVLGTRDYLRKNGFADAVLGLSGGIDSSLVAVIAVEALGADHVHGVLMPSRYSSAGSVDDARSLCAALGIDGQVIAIEPAHHALLDMLAPSFADRAADLTEENLQSRIRGVLLMALSNKFGWLVLTTGNKSEVAVGYSTLYGDSAGGFAVIKDVFKTRVYELCRYINTRAGREVISDDVLTKAPSAELRPDQRDDQSLPPYDDLDPLLAAYIEDDRTNAELVELGFDEAVVRRITRLVDLAEYKRRQNPPGVRITAKAFGKDRRLPMTNRYRG